MDNQKGLLDLLQEFPDLCKVFTLDVLFNKCNKLMPRYYTISSSSKVHPQDLHIAVSLSETTFKSGDSKMGQVSAFLKQYASEGKAMARIFTK